MIWLTWRQFRTQAIAVTGTVVVVAALLLGTRSQLSILGQTTNATLPGQVSQAAVYVYDLATIVALVLPVIIGLFWGAPLITREVEAGTHRLAWNQGITPTRWLVTKLGVTALAAVMVAALCSLVFTWWCGPIDQAIADDTLPGGQLSLPRVAGPIFDSRGVVPIGYALFAFALGVAVGVLIRRTVFAMGVTLAAFVVVRAVVGFWIRPYLISPLHMTVPLTGSIGIQLNDGGTTAITVDRPGAWVLSEQTVNAAGHPITLPDWFSQCVEAPPNPKATMHSCVDQLVAQHYQQQIAYHPSSHFWPLQWAELGLYVGLAALLAGFCVWAVRRRMV